MKPGIPGFSGDRLRAARQLRELRTQVQLAELLNVERQSVSAWESGSANPTGERVTQLAATLNVPAGFFFKPMPDTGGMEPYYRSQKRATQGQRERAEALLLLLSDIAQKVDEHVELPEPALPGTRFSSPFRTLTAEQIEFVASDVREQLGFPDGPLPNLVTLLENRGVVISRDYLAERELDGLSQWLDRRPYILLNDSKSAARSRMDLAHELGHLILHPGMDRLFLNDKPTFDLLERQAFRFAGALLLPREEFIVNLRTFRLDEMLGIKVRYQVSLATVIKRIADLELMPEEETVRLWKMRSRGRWHTTEPMEDAVRTEQPQLLRNGLRLLEEEAGIPLPSLIDSASVPQAEFIRLAGYGEHLLMPANVVNLFGRS